MKFKIQDNHLLIFYANGKRKENATENQNECKYCIHNPKNCEANSKDTKKYGGQYCEHMKCKYEEMD